MTNPVRDSDWSGKPTRPILWRIELSYLSWNNLKSSLNQEVVLLERVNPSHYQLILPSPLMPRLNNLIVDDLLSKEQVVRRTSTTEP